jgi:hypothetical protein
MKTVILRFQKQTKSNSFSDAERWRHLLVCLVDNENDKTDCPVTINYVNK